MSGPKKQLTHTLSRVFFALVLGETKGRFFGAGGVGAEFKGYRV